MTRQIDPKRPATHTAGNEHYRAAKRILGSGPGDTLALQAIGHALLALATPPEPILATAPTDGTPQRLIADGRHVTRKLLDSNMQATAAVVAQLTDYVTATTEADDTAPASVVVDGAHYRVHPDDRGYSPSTVEARTRARAARATAVGYLDDRPGLRSTGETLLAELVAAIDGLLA